MAPNPGFEGAYPECITNGNYSLLPAFRGRSLPPDGDRLNVIGASGHCVTEGVDDAATIVY